MSVGKLIGAALAVCIINIVLKQYKPEYALMMSVVSAAIMLLCTAPYLEEIAQGAISFAERVKADNEYVLIAIKIIGISCITQASVEICRDAGEGALASNLELAGKILMLFAALPAVNSLFDAIERVLP